MTLKTISASGRMDSGMDVHVQCGDFELVMDQPKNAGGKGLGPTPLEVILGTVAGCFGTIGRYIAHQQKIVLRGMQFEIEADYDPDGLLGRNPEVRSGFQALRVTVTIDADLDQEQKQAFLELIEERCPLADNLMNGTRLLSRLA
jgi:putative redox protein